MKKLIVFFAFCTIFANSSSAQVELISADELSNIDIPDSSSSVCLGDYKKLRTKYAVQSGLAPFLGFGSFAGAVGIGLSYEYGALAVIRKSALAPVAGVTLNFIMPFGLIAGYVAFETYSIVKYVKANRATRLLKDVYGLGNGKTLKNVTESLQKDNSNITEDLVKDKLLSADQSGDLCNGNWKKKKKNQKRIRNRVALIPDIERNLLNSF